jgi:hypothetical protein
MELFMALIAFFGLIVVIQLRGISKRLDNVQGSLTKITKTLDVLEDGSFAHRLLDQFRRHKEDSFARWLNDEFQWYKDGTFANFLNDRLSEMRTGISEEIRSAAGDMTSDLRSEIADVSQKLDAWE